MQKVFAGFLVLVYITFVTINVRKLVISLKRKKNEMLTIREQEDADRAVKEAIVMLVLALMLAIYIGNMVAKVLKIYFPTS